MLKGFATGQAIFLGLSPRPRDVRRLDQRGRQGRAGHSDSPRGRPRLAGIYVVPPPTLIGATIFHFLLHSRPFNLLYPEQTQLCPKQQTLAESLHQRRALAFSSRVLNGKKKNKGGAPGLGIFLSSVVALHCERPAAPFGPGQSANPTPLLPSQCTTPAAAIGPFRLGWLREQSNQDSWQCSPQ